jgi:hypothetical protein
MRRVVATTAMELMAARLGFYSAVRHVFPHATVFVDRLVEKAE